MSVDSGGGNNWVGSAVATVRSWIDFFGGGTSNMGQFEARAAAARARAQTGLQTQVASNSSPGRSYVSVPDVVSRSPIVASATGWLLGSNPAPSPAPVRRPRRTRKPRRPAPRRRTPAPRKPERTPTPRTAPTVEPPSAPPANVPRRIRLPSVPGTLIDIWWKIIEEYTAPTPRKPTPGGDRRRGPRTRQPTAPPLPPLPTPGPIPVPALPPPARRPLPGDIFDAPPAIENPFSKDAFPTPTVRTSAPARRAVPRRGTVSPLEALLSSPLSALSQPAPRFPRRNDRRRSTRTEDSPPRREANQPGGLTQLQRGQLDLPPSSSSDPCAQAAREKRRQQRRRRKDCTKFVTKEIRVCQSYNAK